MWREAHVQIQDGIGDDGGDQEKEETEMKPNYEQQARELAERCAMQFIDRGVMLTPLPGNKPTVPMEIILRELNLAKLLEDAAMLDWLEHGANLHKMDQTSVKLKDYKLETWDYRTAIRNAMKEDKPS